MRTAAHTSFTTAVCSTSYRNSCRGREARAIRCSGHATEEGLTVQPVERRPLVVKSIPATRAAAPPPQPVPVEHSSSYLLRNRRQLSSADAAAAAAASGGTQREGQEPFSGSAVEWVLRKADESLDEIEENPPEYVKVLYDVSSGPIGKTASATVTTAAKATVLVGANALKAAAPVGKWALQQGFKLAVGAVSKGLTEAISSGSKKDSGGSSKKDSGGSGKKDGGSDMK